MPSSSSIIIILLLTGIIGFIVNHFYKAGAFSTTNNFNVENCQVVSNFAGPEDTQIDYDTDILYISSNNWGGSDKENINTIGVFALDLKKKDAKPKLISLDAPKNFQPHGINLYKDPKTGEKTLFVVNHQHPPQVEAFDVIDRETIKHRETFINSELISINEIVGVGKRSFYVTQDSKYFGSKPLLLVSTLLGFEQGSLHYYNGENWKVIADDVHFANGLACSHDMKTLYLGETNSMRIRVYERNTENGDLKLKEFIDLGAAPDNINVDPQGNLWVAGFPNILAIFLHIQNKTMKSPVHIMKLTVEGNKVVDIKRVLTSTGENISGISAVASYKDKFFISGIMNPELRICSLPKNTQAKTKENIDL